MVAAFADDMIFLPNGTLYFPPEPAPAPARVWLSFIKERHKLICPHLPLSTYGQVIEFDVSPPLVSLLYTLFTFDPSNLYSANFAPLLICLRADLLHWHLLTLMWFGRCNTLKITMLPRVLYLMQALPVGLPPAFFGALALCFDTSSGLIAGPCIKLQLLSLPKHWGGVGLPYVKAYYRATHLTRQVNWHCHV